MRAARLTIGLICVIPFALGAKLPERLAGLATQPDVVLTPPVGEPSPKAGSFVIPYAPADGEVADDSKVGTYGVGPSSCSETLVFKSVEAVEHRQEMWLVETGIGANLGLPMLNIGGSWGRKSVAGMTYDVSEKLIVDTGLEELEMCCLQSPEKCTSEYISEVWRGTGEVHRMVGTNATIKGTVKEIERSGMIGFEHSKGWSVASSWDKPMYFAYRTAQFQAPVCESYMNNLPETEGKVLFTGVSERLESEAKAREGGRDDARRQVVSYLGENWVIVDDEALSTAEALLSGVKDSLVCLDPVQDSPDGPRYLARVRMYVDSAKVEAAMSEMESKTE